MGEAVSVYGPLQKADGETKLSAFTYVEVVFWVACGAVVYTYLLYPLLLAILSVFARRSDPSPSYFPTISILIAAFNEEAAIGRKLEETLALDYPTNRMEVLVLSDCSSDRTDEIVHSCPDPRVRLVRGASRYGKTHVQNLGAQEAKGEILVFSDATTHYNNDALRYLVSKYQDPRVGAVAGHSVYFNASTSSASGIGTIVYWTYENLIKRFQARIYSLTGCSGCIYSVRRALYTELAADIISDLVQPLWVLKKGFRVAFDERALGHEETTNTSAQEFAMRVRVVTRAIRGLLSVRELLNPFRHPWIAFQLWSHKVLRWMVPLALVVMFITSALLSVDIAFFRYATVAQAAFYVAAALGMVAPVRRHLRILGIPAFFCLINLAAVRGVAECVLGKKYVVWEPPRPFEKKAE